MEAITHIEQYVFVQVGNPNIICSSNVFRRALVSLTLENDPMLSGLINFHVLHHVLSLDSDS